MIKRLISKKAEIEDDTPEIIGAIAHCYDVAYEGYSCTRNCSNEHIKLAKWLQELLDARREIASLREQLKTQTINDGDN